MILNIVLLIVVATKTQGFILSLGTQAPPGPKAFDPSKIFYVLTYFVA